MLFVGVVDLIGFWMGFFEQSLLPEYYFLLLMLSVFIYAGFERASRDS